MKSNLTHFALIGLITASALMTATDAQAQRFGGRGFSFSFGNEDFGIRVTKGGVGIRIGPGHGGPAPCHGNRGPILVPHNQHGHHGHPTHGHHGIRGGRSYVDPLAPHYIPQNTFSQRNSTIYQTPIRQFPGNQRFRQGFPINPNMQHNHHHH